MFYYTINCSDESLIYLLLVCLIYLLSVDDALSLISIQSQRWESGSPTDGITYQCSTLKLHTRSSLRIPVAMKKETSVLRISFQWKGYAFSRLVIKVVKDSKILFEIEDWTTPSLYYEWSMIDRNYNLSHEYIKNLEEGCHFELHYAVGGNGKYDYLEIKDFKLNIEGKRIEGTIAYLYEL